MPTRTATRLLAPFAVLALAGVVLAGCSGTASPKGSGSAASASSNTCAPASDGPAAGAVKVSSDVKTEPTVAFTSPIKATATERHVVKEGTGRKTGIGDLLNLEFTLYNGSTGKVATSTGFGAAGQVVPISVRDGKAVPGLIKTVECAKVGSRIVGVVPPKDAWGSKGYQDFGIGAKDVVVFVIDVREAFARDAKADGVAQTAPAGFPTVKLAKSGKPTVTLPKNPATPPQTMIGLLKQGDGAIVQAGSTVAVQYQGIDAASGKIFDQSWGDGPRSFSVDGVIPGFTKALVGQKVGSQVIAVIPPVDGYGASGNPQAGIKGTDPIVFVVDILGTQATPAQ